MGCTLFLCPSTSLLAKKGVKKSASLSPPLVPIPTQSIGGTTSSSLPFESIPSSSPHIVWLLVQLEISRPTPRGALVWLPTYSDVSLESVQIQRSGLAHCTCSLPSLMLIILSPFPDRP